MYDSFAAVTRDRVELARLSKATLSDLSHVLENMLLDSGMPGVVLTGFQVDGNWMSELNRYQRLVEPDARTVAVFASGELTDTGSVMGFELPAASGLRQEWFIVVQAEQFSCALFGVDNPDPGAELPIDEMDRLFDATWTFEPDIVGELSQLVLGVARMTDPDGADRLEASLGEFPPRTASRELEARFHQRMFATMEVGRQRWRSQVVREFLLRERLQDAETRLRRLERLAALGTTVASLAHEINNPLGTIMLASDLIADEVSSVRSAIDVDETPGVVARLETIASHSDLIGGASARVGRLVHGMLDLARTGEIRLEKVELMPWLHRVTEELSVSLSHDVQVIGDAAVSVSIDPDRIRHVLTNLVRNGTEADPSGTPVVVEVEVPSRADASAVGSVTLAVRDHGSGIPEAVARRLFQPFVTSKVDEGGTGLGLVLAQRFARECNGELTLRSTSSAGTVFAVTLPTLSSADTRTADSGGVADRASAVVADEPRVALVLDDDPGIRATLGQMLESSGWSVLLANDTEAAFDTLSDQACNIMIADWGEMNQGSGFDDFSAKLESIRPGITSRMIVITGSLESEIPKHVRPMILPKPFGRRNLQQAITQVTSA